MSTPVTAVPATRRWPYAGHGQKPLLLGAVLIVLGSLLPWVMTPFGNLSGLRGAGLWTLYLGVIGIPGAVLRSRRLAWWHALLAGVPAVVLTAWQLVRLVELGWRTGTFTGALPGMGLLLVLGGGVLALRAAAPLRG
jgi:hypothetical protein